MDESGCKERRFLKDRRGLLREWKSSNKGGKG